MNHSTGKPTKAQQWRIEALADMKCIACFIEGCAQPNRTEVHHLVDKGYRKHSGGHDATLPLCGWHHRGVPIEGVSAQDMIFYCGPSMALNKRRFEEFYGTQRELLERVNGLLEHAA